MKLLVINPNISESVSDLIRAEAERVASPGTEVVVRTAPAGVAYIETRLESLIAAPQVAELIAAEPDVDAVVVAAFGDPGMPALKELVAQPVVGITEAALSTAALLGRRFSIVAISRRITAWYRDCVEQNGFGSRLASIRSLGEALPDIGSVQHDFRPHLLRLANEVVEQDGADVVILAGAPLAGLARDIGGSIPVPVVDGISAGVGQAELLVRLQPGSHRLGSFAPPPVKPNTGLSPELTELLGRAADLTPDPHRDQETP
jgi:Asp/Glu/hydantoin racemase